MHCRMFSSIPGLHLLDARSTSSVMTTKNVSRHQMSPWLGVLCPDCGIPPNTTGAADRCKSSEELYYKLEQGLSSHNGEGAPSESCESFLYCLAGTAGREA